MAIEEILYILYSDHLEVRDGDSVQLIHLANHPIKFIHHYILGDNGLYTLQGELYKMMAKSCIYGDYLKNTFVFATIQYFCVDHCDSTMASDFERIDIHIQDVKLFELNELYVGFLSISGSNGSEFHMYENYTLKKVVNLQSIYHSITMGDYLLFLGDLGILELQMELLTDDVEYHVLKVPSGVPSSLVHSEDCLYVLCQDNLHCYTKSTGRWNKHSIRAGNYAKLILNQLYCWSELIPLSQINLNTFEQYRMENRVVHQVYDDIVLYTSEFGNISSSFYRYNNNKRMDIQNTIHSPQNPILAVFVAQNYLSISFITSSRIISLENEPLLPIINDEPTSHVIEYQNQIVQVCRNKINFMDTATLSSTTHVESGTIETIFVFQDQLFFTQSQSIFLYDEIPLLYAQVPCHITTITTSDAIYTIGDNMYKITNKFEVQSIPVHIPNYSCIYATDLILIGTKDGYLYVYNGFEVLDPLSIGVSPVIITHKYIFTNVSYEYTIVNGNLYLTRILDEPLTMILKCGNNHIVAKHDKIDLCTFYDEFGQYEVLTSIEKDNTVIELHINESRWNNRYIGMCMGYPIKLEYDKLSISTLNYSIDFKYTYCKLKSVLDDLFIIEFDSKSILFQFTDSDLKSTYLQDNFCHSLLKSRDINILYCFNNQIIKLGSSGPIIVVEASNRILSSFMSDMLYVGTKYDLCAYDSDYNLVCTIDNGSCCLFVKELIIISCDSFSNLFGYTINYNRFETIFTCYMNTPLYKIVDKVHYFECFGECGSKYLLHLTHDDLIIDMELLIIDKTSKYKEMNFNYNSFGIIYLDALCTIPGVNLRNKLQIQS